MFKVNAEEIRKELEEKMAKLKEVDKKLKETAKPEEKKTRKKLFWIEMCDPREIPPDWEGLEEHSFLDQDEDICEPFAVSESDPYHTYYWGDD